MQNNDQHPAPDADAVSAANSADVEALKARVAELEAEKIEQRESVLREKAELENQRRRLHRDLEQARRFANEKLLNELLPVFDGLEGGLAVETADVAAMRQGLGLTLKSLLKVGENHGLAQVDPLGQPLDPERHHAVSMVESPGAEAGTVVSVLQKGYVLNDRLLRPALVAVAKD
ncbi:MULTISPECIES: nucleotide exchange factor GrpE [Rhodanobacter]|uniref:Protein GrpE n=1 Tax=Rhodanobacter hydrolyticus TaxID=2250595 RepID=A0ABW8J2W6_9GAMM|nr:nucleotide exchange factor GrpE [Rhodanobacter sp. 7MK24]MBD8880701.1 nucleotide exchange factor GrpE [Rhodanobacter sp. 7MK24]